MVSVATICNDSVTVCKTIFKDLQNCVTVCNGHSRIILVSWGHLGVILGSSWGHLGFITGSAFGFILGWSLGNLGFILGSCHLGVILGSAWDHLEVIVRSCLGHVGVHLGFFSKSSGNHFVSALALIALALIALAFHSIGHSACLLLLQHMQL